MAATPRMADHDDHSDQLHVMERIRLTDRTDASSDVTIGRSRNLRSTVGGELQTQIEPTWKGIELACDDNDRCRAGNRIESHGQMSSTQ